MQALCESELFEIVCLVTKPLQCDRSGNPILTPARKVAEFYGLPISGQKDVNSTEFFEFLYLVRPDLIFVCDFGQILSKQTLLGSILGGINLHGSLLPKFRGAAPVHWAIMTGELYTGVSVIHMTPKVDAGPVIAQSQPIPIGPTENAVELEARLANYGAKLVDDVVHNMAANETIRIIEQLHSKVSKAPRLKKEDGMIDWNRPAAEIFNRYRAMVHWPKTFTDWHRPDGQTVRLLIGKMTLLDDSLHELDHQEKDAVRFDVLDLTDAKMDNLAQLRTTPKVFSDRHTDQTVHRPVWWQPGTVIKAEGGMLIIASGAGALRIFEIQPAGKKMMTAQDFLRGYSIKQGDRFGG